MENYELIIEKARIEAESIIENAKCEANKILSESILLKEVRKEALRIKAEVFDAIKKEKSNAQPVESIFKYQSSDYLYENLWKVQKFDTKKYALFDSKKGQQTEFKYSMIDRFEGVKDNHFLVGIWDNGLTFGLINEIGEEIIAVNRDSTDKVLEEYKKLF